MPPKELLSFTPVRGIDGIKEAELTVGENTVKVAVIHGTANAKRIIEKLKNKEAHYDFIEVMTCRGGCISGGGQPKTTLEVTDLIRFKRIAGLYYKDNSMTLRNSHDNPEIKEVYESFYGKPLSELAEKMLHTCYDSKHYMLGEAE